MILKQNKILSNFGLFIDIDGVIARGRDVLEPAKIAFNKWIFDKEMKIPHIFLTNSGTSSTMQKALFLSKLLECNILPNQVIMSYNPLIYFNDLKKYNAMIVGQGPITNISHNLGFENINTIENVDKTFPLLDMVANEKRELIVKDDESKMDFSSIKSILLFGEPVRWETSLQILIDLLVTDGKITPKMDKFPYPHLPIISCNSDFLWMAQWKNPRFGHGAFLKCLESLYKGLTGNQLQYSAILGKPNELNYLCAESSLLDVVSELIPSIPASSIHTIYAIGDNVESDIVGGNVYNALLKQRAKQAGDDFRNILASRSYVNLVDWSRFKDLEKSSVKHCKTILVQTGVYHSEFDDERKKAYHLSYNHEYFNVNTKFRKPDYVVDNFYQAMELICDLEKL